MSTPTLAEPTYVTAPNRSIDAANGVSYAYRRFGNAERGAPPLVFLEHSRGNLDNWDPALVDPIARERKVVLVDNAGLAGSTGAVPRTFTAMAHNVAAEVNGFLG
jgi:pimeloyl-ACP methyl ester carboxylesterase